jgi:hypothetical protein
MSCHTNNRLLQKYFKQSIEKNMMGNNAVWRDEKAAKCIITHHILFNLNYII